jgi:hypothetical protein
VGFSGNSVIKLTGFIKHKEFLYQLSDFHWHYSCFICLLPSSLGICLCTSVYFSFLYISNNRKVFFAYCNNDICLGSHFGDRNVLSLLRYMTCFGGENIFEQKPINVRLENLALFPFHFLISSETFAVGFVTTYSPT